MAEWAKRPSRDAGTDVRNSSHNPRTPPKARPVGRTRPQKVGRYMATTARMAPSWMTISKVSALGPVNRAGVPR